MTSPSKMSGRHLFVFDFDETIVQCNSDTWIYSLAPDGKIPDVLTKGFDGVNWTDFMRKVFDYLHTKGATKEGYVQCLQEMPFVDGMKDLLTTLALANLDNSTGRKYEIIVISDANSFFIDTFLEFHGLRNAFTKIFTNPGYFDEDGKLHIEEYHKQDWCELSAVNLCKGHILEEYIKERAADKVTFSRICYCGDGQNDLCPSLRLKRCTDVTFPRQGYSFAKILKREPKTAAQMKAEVALWKSGLDIMAHIGQENLSKSSKLWSPITSGISLPTPPPSPPEETN